MPPTIIPVVYTQHPLQPRERPQNTCNRYSIQDHGQGYRTYSYEFDLIDYDPEQIVVYLDDFGTLKIRASRPPFHEFKREYNLGGPNLESTLVRNTIDSHGRLQVDIDVRPRRYDLPLNSISSPNNLITLDLQGYRPENVTVRINRHGLLKVNAQHVDNTCGNQINREFYRQYQLPPNVDPDRVRARMDEHQILTIELPPPSPTTNYIKREYWPPYYGRDYPPFYGHGPYGTGYCCCNIL